MFKNFIEKLLELVYPNRCVICDEVLPYGFDRGVCPKCLPVSEALCLLGSLCIKCGKHHPSTSGELCYDCSRLERKFESGRGVWLYTGQVKDSIHRFKYRGKPDLAVSFAKEAAAYYKATAGWEIDAIVPVPLHPGRLKERGFDHCRLMAAELGELLELPVIQDALLRDKETSPQHGLNNTERRSNLKEAIIINRHKREQVAESNILVVDDIFTSGATVDACARALQKAGADKVYFLVLAIGAGY